MNMRHGGQDALNFTFADGHAESVRRDTVINDDPQSQNYWENLGLNNRQSFFYSPNMLDRRDFAREVHDRADSQLATRFDAGSSRPPPPVRWRRLSRVSGHSANASSKA